MSTGAKVSVNLGKPIWPLHLVFILVTMFCLVAWTIIAKAGANPLVILLGNATIYGACLLSYRMATRSMGNPNPHAFVRAIYASTFSKMGICLFAVLLYIFLAPPVNRASLFTCMGLYLVYTWLEVSILNKQTRIRKNG